MKHLNFYDNSTTTFKGCRTDVPGALEHSCFLQVACRETIRLSESFGALGVVNFSSTVKSVCLILTSPGDGSKLIQCKRNRKALIRHSLWAATTWAIFTKASLIDQFRNFHLGNSTQIGHSSFLTEQAMLRNKQSTSLCGCLWSGYSVLHLTSRWGTVCLLTHYLLGMNASEDGFRSGEKEWEKSLHSESLLLSHEFGISGSSAHPWKPLTFVLHYTEKRIVYWTLEASNLLVGYQQTFFIMQSPYHIPRTKWNAAHITRTFQMTRNNPSPWSLVLIIGTLWIKQTPWKDTLHIRSPRHMQSTQIHTGSMKNNPK